MQEIKFALIYENEIKNKFECENYELANVLARASFGNDAFAVESTQYAINIGDKYENGIFYHILEDGSIQEARYIPTEREKIIKLEELLSNTQLTLLDTYEEKVKLQNEIEKLQLQINKILEGK